MTKNTEQKKKTIELQLDQSIKNVWIDNMHLAGRDDGIFCVRLSTHLPEGHIEQLRFLTDKNRLKEFIQTLCSTINYYPCKEQTKEKKK